MKEDSLSQLTRFLTFRRELVLAIGIVLVAIILVVAVIIPQVNATLQLQGTVRQSQADKQALLQKNEFLQNINATPLLSQEAAVNAALPDSKPLTELLTAISGIAQVSQVAISKVNLTPGLISTSSAQTTQLAPAPVSKSTIPGVDAMKIEVSVQGSFEQVNDFLSRVETMSPLSIVNIFNLRENASIDEGIPTFEATLTIDTYFYTQTVVATIEQELPEVDAVGLQTLEQLATFSRPNVILPAQIVGGGVEDLFGLSQSQIDAALQSTPGPTPSSEPEATPTTSPTTGTSQ